MTNIINCTQIKSSKNFEKNVLKFFPQTNFDIFLDVVGIFRNNSFGGRYLNKVDFVINGEFLTLKQDHNDSEGWDNYQDWEVHSKKYQNWAKSTVLSLLAENKETVNDFFFEEELEANI